MSIVLDVILVVIIILGTILGAKKGLIKTLVSLVGLIAITIISYTLRIPIANFLIDNLPFFTFGDKLAGLTALNIIIYNALAFVVIFVVLYCILNIVMSITKFIDTLLKFTVIWVVPSKIGGAIIGLLETVVYLFIILFVLSQFNFTNNLVTGSTVGNFILDHTPVVGNYLSGAKTAATEIYKSIAEDVKDESKTTKDINIKILQLEINYGLITKDKANELIQTGKLDLEGVQIAKKEISKWLNI